MALFRIEPDRTSPDLCHIGVGAGVSQGTEEGMKLMAISKFIELAPETVGVGTGALG